MKETKPQLPPYVVLKKGQWHVRLQFRTSFTDAKGNRKYEQVSRQCEPETPERAAQIVDILRAEMNLALANTEPATEGETVYEYLLKFLEHKSISVGRRTIQDYHSWTRRYVKGSAFASQQLSKVKPIHLQDFYSKLLRDGVSSSAIHKIDGLLKTMFKRAALWGDIQDSPHQGIEMPKYVRPESVSFTQKQTKAFIETCRKNFSEYFVLEFNAFTGLRPQELVALSWDDIDLKKKQLRIKQAAEFDRAGGNPVLKEPKTKSSVRLIKLTDELVDKLKQHKADQDKYITEIKAMAEMPLGKKGTKIYRKRLKIKANALIKLKRFAELRLVFPNSHGGIQTLRNLRERVFQQALKDAKISDGRYSIKCLRHTNASMLARTMHPKALQKHLGHADLKTTMQFYVHLHDDDMDNATGAFGDALA